jgi:hypothetical protein
MASSTAEPKAPPMARAEKASPVAVERKACGAVYWIAAGRRVSGPAWPMPPKTLMAIWPLSKEGLTQA